MYRCVRCDKTFVSKQQLGGHRSKVNCVAAPGALIAPPNPDGANPNATAQPQQSAADDQANQQNQNAADQNTADQNAVPQQINAVPRQQAPQQVRPLSLPQLLARPTRTKANHTVQPARFRRTQRMCDSRNTFKLNEVQDAYDEYCSTVRDCYSDDFWRLFEAVHDQRSGIIDKVLRTARDVFVRTDDFGTFAPNVRCLREKMEQTVGDFQAHVMHDILIDLRPFNLPSGGYEEIRFNFVNPLWAWVTAANAMVSAGATMHFDPKEMFHESRHTRLYGAGNVRTYWLLLHFESTGLCYVNHDLHTYGQLYGQPYICPYLGLLPIHCQAFIDIASVSLLYCQVCRSETN